MASMLEGKPSYYGLILGLLLAGGLIYAANYFLVGPINQEIETADATLRGDAGSLVRTRQ